MKTFSGLGVAMVTPFTKEGKIDYAGLKRLTEHLVNNGADYLVVQGTTGESPVLSQEEKRTVLDYVLEVNAGKLPVVFGIGGNNTATVCEQIRSFDGAGVSGILSASPYYNKPTQEGIYQHYKALASNTDLPIIVYNVPGRTGSNISAETTIRLANDVSNIAAVKEASGDLFQLEEIIDNKPDDFQVLSGDDGLCLAQLALGIDGVISVVGNAFPREFGEMVHLGLFGTFTDAREKHYQLRKIIDLLFKEGNPGGIKACLNQLGICDEHMRLPLVPISDELRQKIYREMAEKDLVKV